LLEAVHFLQSAFHQGRPLSQYAPSAFPQRFIPESAKGYVYTADQRLWPDRYEFLVYRCLRNGLEAGDIFCRDSVRFRSLEDDLLDDQQWQAKDTLIEETGLGPVRLNVCRSGGRSEFQFHRSRIKPSILLLVSDQGRQCGQAYGALW
jgi:hypothetical protein